ncbi:MAG: alpha/beta hydrolase [Gammaproteobacteria bacterium]|nr:alpha/beta hydrolase [Gammaproteobacteria bacterium]
MTTLPPPKTPIDIDGPAGSLEALLEDPGGDARRYAVVCHPHPLHGGTMHNKVVHTLARALQEAGMPTLRFNYRGVGRSTGTYDEGRGETDDALSVMSWGQRRWPGARTLLAGFSFGAGVALRAALAASADGLITVAPAITRLGRELRRPQCPWLIVIGDADELVDCAQVRAWASAFQPPPVLRVFAGGDHFFHGRLQDLRAAVSEYLRTGV